MAETTTDDQQQQQTDDQQQQNAVTDNWYDDLAGEDDGRRELLSQYDSQDAFFESHSAALNRDWRAEIAGDDDKFKSKLERFADPNAFGTAYREAEQKIRSGDVGPQPPGEDATEDEIKEYRREIGVPLEADGYLKDLPEGLVIGDDDKDLVQSFAERMHGKNASPELVHEGLLWYDELQEQMQEAQSNLDTEQAREATDTLRDAWGKDYRTNMSLINGLLESTFGKEAKDQLMNGRYQDGRGFFNDVNVLKGLAEVARKVNPVGPLIPNDTNQVQALHDEIAELEKFMKEHRSEYNKDTAKQNRLRELYDIRLKLEQEES